MKLQIKENYKAKLDELWDNPDYSDIKVIPRGYHSPDSLLLNSLLFIGINPSYDSERSKNNHNSFSSFSQVDNKYQKYFKPFEYISKQTGIKWCHLDLFFFQETAQGYVKELMSSQTGSNFLDEQLKISYEVIEQVTPSVIVVCNSMARNIMGKGESKYNRLNMKFQFDDTIGTDRVNAPNSKLDRVPVFFTSMLSGQRALDIGSKKRLVWHIKNVKQKN